MLNIIRITLKNHPKLKDIDILGEDLAKSLDASKENAELLDLICDCMYHSVRHFLETPFGASTFELTVHFIDAYGRELIRTYRDYQYTQSTLPDIRNMHKADTDQVIDRLFVIIVDKIFQLYYRHYVIPVYEVTDFEGDHFAASSFIINHNNKNYLLTAKHVYFDMDKEQPVLLSDRSYCFGCKREAIDISKSIYTKVHLPDFIIIPIDNQLTREIIGDNFQIIPDNLIDKSKSETKGPLICHGFPYSRNKKHWTPRQDVYILGTYVKFDECSFGLTYDIENTKRMNGTIGAGVSTPGMSGCPIWELSLLNLITKFSLKGLFTGYYKELKKNRGEYIYKAIEYIDNQV